MDEEVTIRDVQGAELVDQSRGQPVCEELRRQERPRGGGSAQRGKKP